MRAQRAGRQPDRNRRDPVCRHPAPSPRWSSPSPKSPAPAAAGADRHHHLQFSHPLAGAAHGGFQGGISAIDLRLHTSVERVDLSQRTVDVAIRYRETPESDLHCTLLHEDRFMQQASPALALERSEDLQRVTLFHVEHRQVPADSRPEENWRRYGPKGLNVEAGLTFSDETHALQAAVAGRGGDRQPAAGARFVAARRAGRAVRDGVTRRQLLQVTTEETAQRPDIIALREWLLRQMTAG
ncbi:hypothetical protein J4732_19160 [Serratia marcescens]|uniref:LysR substrate-binding domain-containing protein n=1 Tax=Serratia marcescens TaxID=615 RepID=A0A939NRW7_SERMA|nr:hypothetical protein [Serratia marcescens]